MSRRLRGLVVACVAASLALAPALPAYAPCHVISFVRDTYTASESAKKVTITVTKNGSLAAPTVDWETVDDTAEAPGDYTEASGTLVLDRTERSFDVAIRDDSTDEPNERFFVRLSNPSAGGCIPSPSIQGDTATVTITDNDAPPPKPPATQTANPDPSPSSPSPSPSVSDSATPTVTSSPLAGGDTDGGGLSGGALAGIVAAVVVLGGAAAVVVRRRFLA